MIEGVSSLNAKLHIWKFLSCSNQHSVLPWRIITNSSNERGKTAPPWQPRLLPNSFRSTHSLAYYKKQVTSKSMKVTALPLQVAGGKDGCGKPQLILVHEKASANNVATTTVVTAEDVKLEGATEMVNGANIYIHSI